MEMRKLIKEGIVRKTSMKPLGREGAWYELLHAILFDDRLLCAGCYLYVEHGSIKTFYAPMGDDIEKAIKEQKPTLIEEF